MKQAAAAPAPKIFYDAVEANRLLDLARDRAAALELALGEVTRFCHLKKSGFCYADCRGQVLCDIRNLHLLRLEELPAEFLIRLVS